MISGVRSAIALRKANDAGAPANLGRLTLMAAGSTATIAPPAAAVPPAVTYGLGMPATQTFDFTTTPSDGQTFQVNLTMPDGASKTLTLVARTTVPSPGAPADELSFAIGATPAATATSFVGAATTALTALTSSSEFSAASSVAGARTMWPTRPTGTAATPARRPGRRRLRASTTTRRSGSGWRPLSRRSRTCWRSWASWRPRASRPRRHRQGPLRGAEPAGSARSSSSPVRRRPAPARPTRSSPRMWTSALRP